MAVKNVEIRVFGKERTRESGEKFVVYSYTPNGKVWYKVAFTKDCSTQPKKTGYYKLVVNPFALSIKEGRLITTPEKTYKENDTLFISDVISFKEDTEYTKVLEAKKREKVEDMLALDEEVPFEETFND